MKLTNNFTNYFWTTLVYCFCCFNSFLFAQETNLYRFIYEGHNEKIKTALCHNTKTNLAEISKVSSNEFSRVKGYLDAFILYGVPNEKGRVFITSAKAPEFFLKANFKTNEVTFDKITKDSNLEPFKWEFVLNRETDGSIISLQTIVKNKFAIKKENERAIIANRLGTKSSDNQNFSFRLEQIVNVF